MKNSVFSTYRNGLYLDDPQYLRIGIFGDLIHQKEFIDQIAPYCEEIFCISSFDSLEDTLENENIQMLFGLVNGECINFEKLKDLRQNKPNITIGMGVMRSDLILIESLLSLECHRYFVEPDETGGLLWEFQKTREIALERTISRYESKMLEAILDAYSVSVADTDGTIFYINNTFAIASGYMPFELIGANHRIFKHPATSYSVYRDLWETISENKVWRGQIFNMTRDGEKVESDTTIIPYFDDRKKRTFYLALRQNIPIK